MKRLLSFVVLFFPFRELVRAFAIATVALPGLLLSNSISLADGTVGDNRANADGIPWTGPVPKAHCGRLDWTESGLQGQTTPWERESGDSEGGYNCNLELVGQFRGEGAYSQDGPAYSDHCAYYGTENDPLQQHPGVVVIDASDPRHPRATAYLDDTPAALRPARDSEGATSGASSSGSPKTMGRISPFMTLSADCAHPVLKSSITAARQPGPHGRLRPGRHDVLHRPELSRHRRLHVHRGRHRPVQSEAAPHLAVHG